MKRVMIQLPCLVGMILGGTLAFAEEVHPVKLPQPQVESGKPLMQALHARKSTREFGSEKLSPQTLSDLLWAAFGINRSATEGRTAPSAHNWQEIDIYVATADGLYLFDAKAQALQPILAQDVRVLTGTQDFVKDAPINLVYVADFTQMDGDIGQEDKKILAAADTGFIGENVYLFCASVGLATVVRGSVDKEALVKAMKLKPTQWIVLAQSVGYPKK